MSEFDGGPNRVYQPLVYAEAAKLMGFKEQFKSPEITREWRITGAELKGRAFDKLSPGNPFRKVIEGIVTCDPETGLSQRTALHYALIIDQRAQDFVRGPTLLLDDDILAANQYDELRAWNTLRDQAKTLTNGGQPVPRKVIVADGFLMMLTVAKLIEIANLYGDTVTFIEAGTSKRITGIRYAYAAD